MQSSADIGVPILTLIVLVPIGGALLTAIAGRRRPELVRLIALLASILAVAWGHAEPAAPRVTLKNRLWTVSIHGLAKVFEADASTMSAMP